MKSLICGISLLTLVASVSFANSTTAPVVNPEAKTVAPVTEVTTETVKVEKKINKKAKKAKKVEMKSETAPVVETAPAMEAAPAAK